MSSGLTEVLERHRPMLDEIFGRGGYALDESDGELCVIRARVAEVAMAYDEQHGWLTCLVKPLLVAEEVQESYPIDDWVRFSGRPAPCRSGGELDDRQVEAELNLLRQVVTETLADPQRARDAVNFLLGYNAAYTELCRPLVDHHHH